MQTRPNGRDKPASVADNPGSRQRDSFAAGRLEGSMGLPSIDPSSFPVP
jgi:hypothetical protein